MNLTNLGYREDFDFEDRVIKQEKVASTDVSCNDTYFVSTVDLGINHGFGGAPLYYETMIFSDSVTMHMERYATRAEAVMGHGRIVDDIENGRYVVDGDSFDFDE